MFLVTTIMKWSLVLRENNWLSCRTRSLSRRIRPDVLRWTTSTALAEYEVGKYQLEPLEPRRKLELERFDLFPWSRSKTWDMRGHEQERSRWRTPIVLRHPVFIDIRRLVSPHFHYFDGPTRLGRLDRAFQHIPRRGCSRID